MKTSESEKFGPFLLNLKMTFRKVIATLKSECKKVLTSSSCSLACLVHSEKVVAKKRNIVFQNEGGVRGRLEVFQKIIEFGPGGHP